MAAFPLFQNNVVSQFPNYAEGEIFAVLQNQMECGKRYAKCLNPGNPYKVITISMAQMSHDEMDQIEAFFNSVGGNTMSFSFTGDDGTVYSNCRFASPELEFQYTEQGGFGFTADINVLIAGS